MSNCGFLNNTPCDTEDEYTYPPMPRQIARQMQGGRQRYEYQDERSRGEHNSETFMRCEREPSRPRYEPEVRFDTIMTFLLFTNLIQTVASLWVLYKMFTGSN